MAPTRTPTATAIDKRIYRETLLSPWTSYSWGAKIFFGNTARAYNGSRAIKVVQKAWGALSLHNGNNVSIDLDPSGYAAVSFAVNGGAAGIHLGVRLESDAGDSFPQVDLGAIPTDTWVKVTVPMSQVNPNGRVFHRVDIQHIGDTGRTYWVDDVELVGR